MLFYPSEPDPSNYLRLAPDGALEIVWQTAPPSGAERFLIPAFRRIGFLTARALCQYPGMGAAIHYAGCLPMRENPGRYELYPDGLLFGTRRVYVADGACFPRLPAKNLTFTIMANAMRIASAIRS
jgi:choline dehydrogenase-like flavoprotein